MRRRIHADERATLVRAMGRKMAPVFVRDGVVGARRQQAIGHVFQATLDGNGERRPLRGVLTTEGGEDRSVVHPPCHGVAARFLAIT